MAAAVLLLSACNIPETKKVYYEGNSKYLKELYSAYEKDGKEIRHGLYIKFKPNGEKAAEIYYEHNEPVSITVFNEEGRPLPVENIALYREMMNSES